MIPFLILPRNDCAIKDLFHCAYVSSSFTVRNNDIVTVGLAILWIAGLSLLV